MILLPALACLIATWINSLRGIGMADYNTRTMFAQRSYLYPQCFVRNRPSTLLGSGETRGPTPSSIHTHASEDSPREPERQYALDWSALLALLGTLKCKFAIDSVITLRWPLDMILAQPIVLDRLENVCLLTMTYHACRLMSLPLHLPTSLHATDTMDAVSKGWNAPKVG